MNELYLRPRFEFVTDVEPNEVLRRLADRLAQPDATVSGKVFDSSAVLKIHPSSLHFWSPQLQLSIDPHLPSGSLIHGLFGPRPAVWGLFVALYAAIGFSTLMGVIFGYSQVSLGQSGTALWSGPIGIGLAGFVYLVGRTGRQLGSDQIEILKLFLEQALETDEKDSLDESNHLD
jgi:hypothetical protein